MKARRGSSRAARRPPLLARCTTMNIDFRWGCQGQLGCWFHAVFCPRGPPPPQLIHSLGTTPDGEPGSHTKPEARMESSDPASIPADGADESPRVPWVPRESCGDAAPRPPLAMAGESISTYISTAATNERPLPWATGSSTAARDVSRSRGPMGWTT